MTLERSSWGLEARNDPKTRLPGAAAQATAPRRTTNKEAPRRKRVAYRMRSPAEEFADVRAPRNVRTSE